MPCVATGNVHAHERARVALQDAMVAVRLGRTLDETEPQRRGNSSHVLAPPERMAARFREHPDAVAESGRLAERLRFDLTEDLGYRYPGAEDESADATLAQICAERVGERYAGRSTLDQARARLDEELRVIRHLGLSGFFLLHRDMLELARDVAAEVRGNDSARRLLPPGRGRGSSVSSIVCYLTGLSHVDPIENELFLGRFLNEELTALPDIDLDFPRDIRDVLIPRVHQRYGRDRCALVSAFATFQVRSAVRDFAKALGLPPGEVERLARAVDPWKDRNDIEGDVPQGRSRSPRWDALVQLARDAWRLPRHVTQHPGGMVISTQSLIDLCPVQPASMEGRQIVQWDKDSCGDAGFLKIDLLGLGMLSAVERCVDEIARVRGESIDLSRIDFDDRRVYGEIQAAETMGVFQIESRAQMQMLKRTKPENLDDITVQVALVRPGPILGGAVHPYIERRKRLRADPSYRVPYAHPVAGGAAARHARRDRLPGPGDRGRDGLRRLHGRRGRGAAAGDEPQALGGGDARLRGEVPGRGDRARRLARGGGDGLVADRRLLRLRLPEGALGRLRPARLPVDLAARPLRRRVPLLAAQRAADGLLPARLARARGPAARAGGAGSLRRAQRRGLPGRALAGGRARRAPGPRLRQRREGRRGPRAGRRARAGRPVSLDRRPRRPLRRLGRDAGKARLGRRLRRAARRRRGPAVQAAPAAFPDFLRRRALWLLGVAVPGTKVKGGTQLALPLDPHEGPQLRALTAWERMLADYGSTGVTLREHPLELMRPSLPGTLRSSQELERAGHGTRVEVAGLVVARQRPATANGITFMLLEDEFGTINLIVPPPVHDRCRLAIRGEPLVWAAGRVEHAEGTTNVLVDTVERLERPDLPRAEVKHIEPRRTWSTDGQDGFQAEEQESDLRAVVPAGHSFGRRGR